MSLAFSDPEQGSHVLSPGSKTRGTRPKFSGPADAGPITPLLFTIGMRVASADNKPWWRTQSMIHSFGGLDRALRKNWVADSVVPLLYWMVYSMPVVEERAPSFSIKDSGSVMGGEAA